ncbi:MAG: helix-turn-helix domain-containing protein [Planctomycetota bacterium]|jgi:transcriptional regulator with XRE-family HTH domain
MRWEWQTFGGMFKELRIGTGLTLRQFCQEYGFDPGNISKMERGLMPPPQSRDVLERYARCLGLQRASREWHAFHDLAAAEAGRIPEDLRGEQLVRRLPALFRTLRARKVSEKLLDELIERLRRE